MEDDLDKIADGSLGKDDFLTKLQRELKIDISVLRTIDHYSDHHEVSIRKGKTNDYIFVQRQAKAKPTFLSLKDFTGCYLSCDEQTLIDYIDLRLFPDRCSNDKG